MASSLMMVDGDAALRALFTDALHDEGYLVRGCATVQQAGLELAITAPDLLLLDISQHAAVDGLALVTHVRLQRATYDLPMLICSTDQRLLHREGPRLRALGCAVLAKPFALETLFAMIARLLSTPHGGEQSRAVGEPSCWMVGAVHARPTRGRADDRYRAGQAPRRAAESSRRGGMGGRGGHGPHWRHADAGAGGILPPLIGRCLAPLGCGDHASMRWGFPYEVRHEHEPV